MLASSMQSTRKLHGFHAHPFEHWIGLPNAIEYSCRRGAIMGTVISAETVVDSPKRIVAAGLFIRHEAPQ
ncbi:hypothetical protein WS61_07420 [Burkholderia sp. ABCPW 11]|nr:hypothetical protein WS61_07420 [Burkholderia sp. ABCPW 11]